MCVDSIIKSHWAEVQQFWVPARLFYKHRFSIDTEWSIFPKTVLIHLINLSTKEILLFFTTAYRAFSNSCKAEFTWRDMDSILIRAVFWQYAAYLNFWKASHNANWKGVCIEMHADCGYSFTVTSKHTLGIELIQTINISSFCTTQNAVTMHGNKH